MSDKGLIFISYKREDQVFAEQLREQLHAWGWRTWMDIFDIPKGAYWPDEIQAGLDAADLVVGVLSPNSVQSRNVKNEWDWSIVYKKRLILLMVENCVVPMNYISLNWIEYHKAPDAAYIQLKTALELGKPITGSANIILEPVTLRATATVTTPDPYQDYLQKLYERLNKALAQRVIKRKDENSQEAEPLHLRSSSTPEAVDELFAKRDEIDPLFEAMGIAQDVTKQDFADFESAFNYYEGQLLLLGEPGAGKTITLLQFARDAVVRRIKDPTAKLPIFAVLPEWSQKGMPSISDWMAQTYGAPHDAPKLVHEGKVLLLLDGLDELGGERFVDPHNPDSEKFDPRAQIIQSLNTLVSKDDSHIVITCRLEDYLKIGVKIHLKGAITLKKLDKKQIEIYLRDVSGLADLFNSDSEMQRIAETPLLLSLISYAFRDKPKEVEELRSLDENGVQDKIFSAYVRERYAHEERKYLIRRDQIHFTLNEIYEILGYLAISSFHGYIDLEKYKTNDILLSFCVELGFLISYSQDSINFVHLLLYDHFIRAFATKHIQDTNTVLRFISTYNLLRLSSEFFDEISKSLILSEEIYCIRFLLRKFSRDFNAAKFEGTKKPFTVLIAKHDLGNRLLYRILMTRKFESVFIFDLEDGFRAIDIAEIIQPDIVIIGNILVGLSGIEVITHIRKNNQQTFIIYDSDGKDPRWNPQALIAGANDILNWPQDFGFLEIIQDVIEKRSTRTSFDFIHLVPILINVLHKNNYGYILRNDINIAIKYLHAIGTSEALSAIEKWNRKKNNEPPHSP